MESGSDLDALLPVIMRETTLATGAESCSLALYDREQDQLQFCVARGDEEEREFERKLTMISIPMGAGIIGWCAEHTQPVNIRDAYGDPRFNREADKQTGFTTRSILAVPMVRHGELIGVVEAVNKKEEGVFSDRDEQVLVVLAAQASLAIENARLIEENVRQARFSALGQGIAGAAHCIKNILNGVVGGGYILEIGLKGKDLTGVDEGWGILKRNVDFMRSLVLDMLSFSRPETPTREATDVNRLCVDVGELMRSKSGGSEICVRLDLDEHIGEAELDGKGIYRCILNLVTNALDACAGARGTVTISTRSVADPDGVEIVVTDTGCGIAEEDLPQVFRVFYSTKGSDGTGLGLAVTQKIVREHGGEIAVESRRGTGTSFTIRLPRNAAE